MLGSEQGAVAGVRESCGGCLEGCDFWMRWTSQGGGPGSIFAELLLSLPPVCWGAPPVAASNHSQRVRVGSEETEDSMPRTGRLGFEHHSPASHLAGPGSA